MLLHLIPFLLVDGLPHEALVLFSPGSFAPGSFPRRFQTTGESEAQKNWDRNFHKKLKDAKIKSFSLRP